MSEVDKYFENLKQWMEQQLEARLVKLVSQQNQIKDEIERLELAQENVSSWVREST